MKKLFFVTTNQFKYDQFCQTVLPLPGFEIHRLNQETVEIQAQTNEEVALHSAIQAAKDTGEIVITEDVGLFIDALNGFPGVYLKDMETMLGADGFLKLMANKTSRQAYWCYSVAIAEPTGQAAVFSTQLDGTIANRKLGSGGWEIDQIFIVKGKTQTIAQELETGVYVRNNDHYKQLKDYLIRLKAA